MFLAWSCPDQSAWKAPAVSEAIDLDPRIQPEPESRQELETAFRLFNQLSVRLEEAYGGLEEKVASLDAALSVARREREAQRVEKERIAERLAGLLAELPVGVVLVSAEGRVEEANQAARVMLNGLEVGREWEVIVEGNLVGSDSTAEVVSRTRRRITLTRRELPGGACVIVLTDVTQIHELESRVARNQRLSEMGEMAARLAHQVRTPVSSAMLYASGMCSATDAATRRSAGRILERLRHLETLVNDMLLFAKGGVGELEPLTVGDLVDDAWRSLDPRLQPLVSTACPGEVASVRIFVNREAMTGALINLACNACESGASQVVLAVRSSSEGYVEFSVADDGPGVAPEIAARIFDPFFTTRSGGTGLGLAVVRSAAQSFGGTAFVESNETGGATFRLRVPRIACPLGEPADALAGIAR